MSSRFSFRPAVALAMLLLAGGIGVGAPGTATPPAPLIPFELGCDTQPPDTQLGIQQNYLGGDCLPGPPFSPGNLVGFAYPFDNDVQNAEIVGIKIFYKNITAPDLTTHLYVWSGDESIPTDACGAELFQRLDAPVEQDTIYTQYEVSPPVPMMLGERLWLGAVYPFTEPVTPIWSIGFIDGVSEPGRAYTNVTGDHSDWFDLDDFGWGQCFAVRLVLEPSGANLPPVADAGGPYCGSSDQPIRFDGSGSFDPEQDPLTFEWDFGDGSTGSGPEPLHLYAGGTAIYTVTLIARDAASADTSVTFAGIDVPATLQVPADVSLDLALRLITACDIDSVLVAPGIYDGPFVLDGSDVVLLATGGADETVLRTTDGTQAVLSILSGTQELHGFTVTGARHGIVATTSTTIEECRVVDCGLNAVVASTAMPVTVRSCLIVGNGPDGVGGGLDLRGAHVVEQTTVDRNGGFGVRTSPFLGGETAIIQNCIITNTLFGPAIKCIGATPLVGCTDIWNNVVNNNCGNSSGGNFTADPLYCDPEAGDYDVHLDSPVVNVPTCGRIGHGDVGCGLAASIVGGTVRDGEQQGIGGLSVAAIDVLSGEEINTVKTGAEGSYTIGGLPPGGYRIEVLSSGSFYLGEYYDDVPSYRPSNIPLAETLWLTIPEERTGIDFELTPGGTFSGAATDGESGGPLSSVPIVAFEFGGDSLRVVETGIDGLYTSVPLPPGDYGAMTPGVGGYVGEYYREVADPGAASPFTVVTSTDTPSIDFTLDRDPIGIGLQTAAPFAPELGNPVPNPFNPSTEIPLALPAAAHVRLLIYDIHGRRVRALVDGMMPAGHHRVHWDGRGEGGGAVASGVYLVRLEMAGNANTDRESTARPLTRRVVLLR